MACAVISADNCGRELLTDFNAVFQREGRIIAGICQMNNAVGIVAKIKSDISFGNSDNCSGKYITFADLAEGSLKLCGIIVHAFCRNRIICRLAYGSSFYSCGGRIGFFCSFGGGISGFHDFFSQIFHFYVFSFFYVSAALKQKRSGRTKRPFPV